MIHVLGITWEHSIRDVLLTDPDNAREIASATSYRSGPEPGMNESYRDFAIVLDYESEDHEWEYEGSRELYDELVEGMD